MEQQEEKKMKVYERRIRRRERSKLSLPLDLTSEILINLPTKCIVRSRCVSKLWSSITTDPYFISSFKTRTSSIKAKSSFILQESGQNSSKRYGNETCQPLDIYQIICPKYYSLSLTESVHGLICFRKSSAPMIYKTWKSIAVYLGYDPIEGKHKVLCLPCVNMWEEEYCRVLTLGSTQWRSIKTIPYHVACTGTYGRCINGVMYYNAFVRDLPEGPRCRVIMSLMLALVYSDYETNGMTFSGLEDAEKHKWSAKSFVAAYSHTDPVLNAKFKLSGVNDAGEFIYLTSTFLRTFYIKYYDLERNSFRTVEFKGVGDHEFRRINGLGNDRFYSLQTFPNHMDSLFSLSNS
ncbi:hypothetical protein CARUB_v10021779mg [Capsella rubella]|uniref:F-box domain-containing protein n=1 Tax=Capsella rubella TaxID=81985 RepID=R0I831_9BRAS|nr:hypothetical protein CARUB_v10021779mg [Capsella rubella]